VLRPPLRYIWPGLGSGLDVKWLYLALKLYSDVPFKRDIKKHLYEGTLVQDTGLLSDAFTASRDAFT
jgi:hypothetical protein